MQTGKVELPFLTCFLYGKSSITDCICGQFYSGSVNSINVYCLVSMTFTYFLSAVTVFAFLFNCSTSLYSCGLVEANFASCLLYFLQSCEPSRVSFIG